MGESGKGQSQTPGGCQRRLPGRHAPAQGVAAVWAAGRQGAGRAGGVRCGGSRGEWPGATGQTGKHAHPGALHGASHMSPASQTPVKRENCQGARRRETVTGVSQQGAQSGEASAVEEQVHLVVHTAHWVAHLLEIHSSVAHLRHICGPDGRLRGGALRCHAGLHTPRGSPPFPTRRLAPGLRDCYNVSGRTPAAERCE